VGTLHPETTGRPSSADAFLTPDDRRREVAAILAAGLMRLNAAQFWPRIQASTPGDRRRTCGPAPQGQRSPNTRLNLVIFRLAM
jgi:hypothetical protein